MPPSNSTSTDENESLKEAKGASPLYGGLEKTDLGLKTDAEHQQDTQDDETVYPVGLKLFLLGSVAPSTLVLEPLVRRIDY